MAVPDALTISRGIQQLEEALGATLLKLSAAYLNAALRPRLRAHLPDHSRDRPSDVAFK
jgi:hypothetical protein